MEGNVTGNVDKLIGHFTMWLIQQHLITHNSNQSTTVELHNIDITVQLLVLQQNCLHQCVHHMVGIIAACQFDQLRDFIAITT